MIKILFVCTGNICRSPTAEGVFRDLARRAGLEGAFHIDSAGVASMHEGEAPDPRSVRTAKKYGIDLSAIRARNMVARDYAEFDYMYAMDGGHLRDMQRRAPKTAQAEILMFMEGTDVPDPWYGGERDFEHAYALIRKGAEDLLKKLKEDHRL